MMPKAGTELEAAHLLVDRPAHGEAEAPDRRQSRKAKLVAIALAAALVFLGVAMCARAPKVSSASAGEVVELASHQNQVPQPAEPFAVVPIVWTVIHKKDGTGKLPETTAQAFVEALNLHFNGSGNAQPGKSPNVAEILKGDSCYDKCNVAMCYKGGAATDLASKEQVEKQCMCGTGYCKDWGFKYDDEKESALLGPNLDTGVGFKLASVKYVENDEWHLQCCCTYAEAKYEIKQQEIFDQAIDKTTIRKVANIIVCDMMTLGGGTAGQSMIGGSASCWGGPGIMLNTGTAKHVESGAMTLAHEVGHHLGLYHTFNEECNGNTGCSVGDACKPDVNAGDHISDTPLHLKQEECNGADSCPDAPGKDPLDNYMSYSGCAHRRFTAEQVKKMHQTVTDYYPEMLVSSHKPEPKDLPCDPEFPSGKVPAGYAPPKPSTGGGGGGGVPQNPPSCQLEVGRCDRFDTTACYCQDARLCCKEYGCGGDGDVKQCLPCSWKAFSPGFTSDSCPDST